MRNLMVFLLFLGSPRPGQRMNKKYSNQSAIASLIPYLKNDKKNNDNKINFILLKKIGKTTLPNKYKISLKNLKKLSKPISQY